MNGRNTTSISRRVQDMAVLRVTLVILTRWPPTLPHSTATTSPPTHAIPALPMPATTTPPPTVAVTLIAPPQVILKHPPVLTVIVVVRASTRCTSIPPGSQGSGGTPCPGGSPHRAFLCHAVSSLIRGHCG